MVKIGAVYVNLEAVEAVAPSFDGNGYKFFLAGGRAIEAENVTEYDLTEVLSREGYYVLPDVEGETPPLADCFTGAELEELAKTRVQGYSYVAKDYNGQVFVYVREPAKGSASWLNETRDSVVRLRAGSYDALSFEDIVPLHIGTIMEEMGS